MPEKIYLVGPAGGLFEDSRGNLEQLARDGYREATPEEVATERAQQLYGGAAGAAKAFGAGVVRGLVPMGADHAAIAVGGEQARAELKGLKEVQAGASIAGEVGGFIAGALGTGGGTVAAKVAAKGAAKAGAAGAARRALGVTPGGMIQRAGRHFSEKAASKLADRGSGALAQRAAELVIREGGEGLVYGAGAYMSQAALEGKELASEQLALSALAGAGLGFGAGAGAGFAGWGLKKLARGAHGVAKSGAEQIAQLRRADLDASRREIRTEIKLDQDLRQSAKASADATAEATATSTADASAVASTELDDLTLAHVMDDATPIRASDQDIADALMSGGEVGKKARATLKIAQHDPGIDGALTEAQQALSLLKNEYTRLGPEMTGPAKYNNVHRMIDAETDARLGASTLAKTQVMVTDALAMMRAQKAARKARKYGTTQLNRAIVRAEEVQGKLAKIPAFGGSAPPGTLAKAHNQLDALKREMGKTVSWSKRKAKDISPALLDSQEKMRLFLEDGQRWGLAGDLQREVNLAWEKLIEAGKIESKNRIFVKGFKPEEVRGTKEAWNDFFEADPTKLGPMLRGITSPDRAQQVRLLREYATRSAGLARAFDKYGKGLTGDITKSRKVVERAAEQLDRAMAKAERLARFNDVWEVMSAGSGVGRRMLGGIASTLSGGISSAGSVRDALSQTSNLGQTVAQSLGQTVDQSISGNLTIGLVQSVGGAGYAQAVRSRALADMLAKGIPRQVARGVSKIAGGARRAATRAIVADRDYLKTQKKIEEGAIVSRADAVAAVSESKLPSTTGGMLDQANAVQKYLAQRLPTSSGDAAIVSRAEAERFERVARGALDPMSLLKDIAAGTVSADAAKAVRDLWPATYGEMVSQMNALVIELRAKGKRLPYREALALNIAFGIASDKTLEPRSVLMQQAAYRSAPKARGRARTKSKPVDLAGDYMTATERLQK